jgi:signal peptidase I
MIVRWFLSSTLREAVELRKQVWVILNSQRDLLAPKALAEVQAGLAAFQHELRTARDNQALSATTARLEECATRWLQPYPNPKMRENLKEFLASGVLILSIFCFFIQPMKIPSGSAQPTLYGNVVTSLPVGDPAAQIPTGWRKYLDWFKGIDYHQWVTKDAGSLEIEPVRSMAGFVKFQRFVVGRDSYTVYWPPDNLERRCGVQPGQQFQKGQTVLRLKISSGDRLFVDRLTYNFRRPERGEVIVFTSTGIPGLIQHTHYIKRLIAMGGERVRVGDDRHVVINGRRLDNRIRHFETVYSFSGPPEESVFSGHVNDKTAIATLGRSIAPLFPNGEAERTIRPNHYLAFGDNTLNSFDGRAWGDFPRNKVVGKALFVFWPFTSRFGLVWW